MNIFIALVLAALVGTVDYATGRDLAVSAFYLIPICWACWTAGRRPGLWLAGLCTLVWLFSDLSSGYQYPYSAIPYWNALMLLGLFIAVVYSLSAFQSAHGRLQEAQSLLENQNERLEKTVRQRTAALEAEIAERKRQENARLQAERLAMVGSIAAQVAHEVRNPLGSITLNLDLLSKEIEKLSATSRHAPQEGGILVNEMREEIRRIQRVIEDYLRFARLPRFQRRPVKLNEYLEQKLAFMGATFEKAGVRLRTEFDSALGTINVDPEQLWQACLNLLQNSLEAMPEGGSLDVSTRRQGDEALLCVADTGNGMTQEQQEQLFVPFFTTKKGGTGLGLPLTLRILNEHGARIECASTVGKGTSFTIHFPLGEASRHGHAAKHTTGR